MFSFVRTFSVLLGVSLLAVPAQAATLTPKADPNGGGYVILEGDIAKGDADRFRKIATAYKLKVVFLNSDGGSLSEALEIGRIISTNNYATFVIDSRRCASSCALIWLAGSPRFAGPEALIGFHASYKLENGEPYESGAANALVGRYLTQLGLPERAVLFATSSPPRGMAWLDVRNPGVEGISYEIMRKRSSEADRAAEFQAPVVRVTVPPASSSRSENQGSLIGRSVGQWKIIELSRGYGAVTFNDDKTGLLGIGCAPGKMCRYLVRLNLGCDAGDQYTLRYQIDGYEEKEVAATCDTDGRSLYINDAQSFYADVTGEIGVTFLTKIEGGEMSQMRFSMLGFDQAISAMKRAGYLEVPN